MSKLFSPAAQAVLDAANSTFEQAGTTRQGIAAALRAAALYCKRDALQLLVIAAELEAKAND